MKENNKKVLVYFKMAKESVEILKRLAIILDITILKNGAKEY